MRMDKLTSKFQMAIADGQSIAVGRDHQFIEPLHIMAALLDQEGGSIPHLLNKADVNIAGLRSALGAALDALPQVSGTDGDVHLSNDAGRVLNVCDKLSQKRKDKFISSELFVLAALETKGTLGDLLRNNGAAKGSLEKAIDELRGGQKSG